RAIAKEAGVATGNAYYYFGSKEELIHAYYARNHAEHAVACRAVLDTETRLDRRIAGVLRALIDVQAPYHSFAAKLYKHAAEPASRTALAVLDGDRALLGARLLARVREDLPAHRRDRAAGRAAGPAGPAAGAAVDDPSAARGARRGPRLAPVSASQPIRPSG